MDAAELVVPLSGRDWWRVDASGDVAALKVTDGPGGARGERFAGGPPSVCFPCGAALGATWDRDLVARVGAALAGEARAKHAHVLLAPTINLQRSPLGGRHFECLSEDPVLTAALATAYVTGLQGGGVAACVKHLVANDIEHDRFEISSEPDERTLREVYLLPFEHALRLAGGWSTMAAYNRLHGTHCSEHPRLLTTILRDEWGWDGVVVSDWFATRSTVPSALAGLDLEMPGPALHWGAALAQAIDAGDVPEEVVLAKRARLRLLGERVGAAGEPGPDGPGGGGEAVAREAAAAAAVLLRNEPVQAGPVLPLPAFLSRIAVVGPHADREVIQGGGSARVTPTAVATVADGLRAAYGDEAVIVEPGPLAARGTPAIDPRSLRRTDGSVGVDVEVLDGTGAVRHRLRPRDFRAVFLDDADPAESIEGWSIRASARYTPSASGPHHFRIKTADEATLTVDGAPVADTVELTAGQAVELAVEARSANPRARLAVELRAAGPEPTDLFERAVRTAAGAEVAVVVVGLDNDWETEGRDREHLDLPGRQVELIQAVAAVQPRTVVVVLAGAPVDLSWAATVPAVIFGWYPGQEGGHGLADVLTGAADPGGRLPCTMPQRLEHTPAFLDTPPDPGVLRYQEGCFSGHRWYDARDLDPAFPFGHGLSYTTFAIGRPTVRTPMVEAGEPAVVDVTVTNSGDRPGTEVVQLYVGDDDATVRRPPRELRGFAKVALAAGEQRQVTFVLGPRDLAFWDAADACWRAEAGTFRCWAGRSSRDLGEPVTLTVAGSWTAPPSDPPTSIAGDLS